MNGNRLWVFLSDQPIGHLDNEGGQLAFCYRADAPAPVSVTMPLRAEPYLDEITRAFFQNLLPEGAWRAALCRQLRIAEHDDFGLLRAVGADCAGAVALHADPEWRPRQGRYAPLAVDELRNWTRNPAGRPAFTSAPGLRLSLAGAQDKLLVHMDDGLAYLCEDGAPSSVILKPDIQDPLSGIELSGLNELLTMTLADACGLETATVFWFAGSYAVKRFDRAPQDAAWVRLHQEDFAQLSGTPTLAKYEQQGGPGWRECFSLLDQYASVPARDRLELLRRLLFNLLVGNFDAHAKNFALLHAIDGSVRLSPAYDLVNTELYPALSRELAMSIGGEAAPSRLDAAAWARFGVDTRLRPTVIARFASTITGAIRQSIDGILATVEAANPALVEDVYPARRRQQFFADYVRRVRANCDLLERSFK
ncbi:MAG: HipA domain-containing protein [Gammaproteobacteria bacterium]